MFKYLIQVRIVQEWDNYTFCFEYLLTFVSRWVGVVSQWDDVSVKGRARGGRTHRDTEEGEAEEQAAKVYAFLARESRDFCRARPSVT